MKNKKKVLKPDQIKKRIKVLGKKISKDYKGKPLVVIGVLKGAFVFMADLIREIKGVNLTCEFIRVASYDGKNSTGNIRVEFDLTQSIAGKHVLLIEDIIDTGRTFRFLKSHILAKKPKSFATACFLYKEIDLELKKDISYMGFDVHPKQFVVGYGMDCNGEMRQLPAVEIL